MKKTIALFLTFIMSCFLIGTKAFAEQGYISSTATSQVELTPDTVTFNIEKVTTLDYKHSRYDFEKAREVYNYFDEYFNEYLYDYYKIIQEILDANKEDITK